MSLKLAAAPASTGGRYAALLGEIADSASLTADGFRVGASSFSVQGPRGCLVRSLTEALHRRWFLLQDLDENGWDDVPVQDAGSVRRLRDLLGRRSYWDSGWEVVGRTEDGRWLVLQDDLLLTVAHDELSGTRGRVKVRFPAERPRATPGFHTVTGLRGPALRTGPLASVYLHLRAGAAAPVFTDLVGYLDSLGLRFTARVLADPAAYDRPDAAVVTASRSAIPSVLRMTLGLHPRVRDGFGDAVPAFTRPMAAGVALADDPAGGDFGRARCRVIASGLVAAGTDAGPESRLAVVHRALASEGLHPAALHLEPGSAEFSLPQW